MEENLLVEIVKILSNYEEPISIEMLAFKTQASIDGVEKCLVKLTEDDYVSLNDGKVELTTKARQPAKIPVSVHVTLGR